MFQLSFNVMWKFDEQIPKYAVTDGQKEQRARIIP